MPSSQALLAVTMNEIVLYVTDVEHSRAFYSAIGAHFAPVWPSETVGSATAYEACLSHPDVFLQLFPARDRPPIRTRLRFEVDNLETVAARLHEVSFDSVIGDIVPVLRATDPDGTGVYVLARRQDKRPPDISSE